MLQNNELLSRLSYHFLLWSDIGYSVSSGQDFFTYILIIVTNLWVWRPTKTTHIALESAVSERPPRPSPALQPPHQGTTTFNIKDTRGAQHMKAYFDSSDLW